MGIHIRLRNEESGISPDPRIRSTYMHGFAVMRSLLNRDILTDLHLGQVMFRGFSAQHGEPRVNNEYSWLNQEFDSDIDSLVSSLDQVRKHRKAQYPLFEPQTLETTVYWTAQVGGKDCIGHLKMREPRADDASARGNIEADILSIGNRKSKSPTDAMSLAGILKERIRTDEMKPDELNSLIELALSGPKDSRQFMSRSCEVVSISNDDEPFSMFHTGIAVGLRSIRGLPPLTYGTVSNLARGLGVLPLHSRKKPRVRLPEMNYTVETLNRGFLTRLLSGEHVQDSIMAGCEEVGVTVTTGSLVASALPNLESFLFVVLESYESVLNSIYDDLSEVRRKLDWFI